MATRAKSIEFDYRHCVPVLSDAELSSCDGEEMKEAEMGRLILCIS